ncbi:MAG TPA: hypothetical protein VN661_11935 [Candidatus Acidoferrales bacterium]|nr:hypothetical protein [Candidatus Acidoferrales bacterium]
MFHLKSSFRFPDGRVWRGHLLSLAATAGVLAFAFAAIAGDQPVHLAPKFTKGQTLRYRIENEITITGQITTPIANPEGASKFEQSANLIVRLDVLDVGGQGGAIRLRATYEKSDAQSHGNGFDAEAQSLDSRYKQLQGHSVEFTILPSGDLSDFRGLEDIFPNRSQADAVLSWARSISAGQAFPRSGIRIGQRWHSDSLVSGSPLQGLAWHADSKYLRDEACEAPDAAPGPLEAADAKDNCAVILTDVSLVRHGSDSDATPETYRRNGLRTSGQWTGAGDSLDFISLPTGFLVRSTQTSSQDMDYRIVSAISGSEIHRVGHVQTQTEITLLRVPPSP